MSTKNIVIGALILAALSYALGRYTAGKPGVKTETKTNQTDVTDTHQQETITETKKPDGTVTTITKIDTVKNETEKTNTDTKTQITSSKPKLNLSLLAATSTHSLLGPPSYGISVSKEFIGPITVGLFGLTNGTLGISIGLNF